MVKTLIYIVAAGILVLLGVDGFLAATGKASAHTLIELGVGGAAVLAFTIAAFIKTVSGTSGWGISWPKRGWKADVTSKLGELEQDGISQDNRLGELESSCESLDSKYDELAEKVEALASSPDEPDGWFATVNTKDENGKLVKVYDLPPEESKDDALASARGSLMARECEGNPVSDAVITLSPTYNA